MTVDQTRTTTAPSTGTNIKTIRATGEWEGSMTTRVRSRQFEFLIDEPTAIGGNDLAPTPMQYVVGAVNGCVSVVIETVASERGVPIRAIRTTSAARQDVRGFQGTAPVSPHFQDFVLSVELDAEIPIDHRADFTSEVERRCPAISLIRDAGVELAIDWVFASTETAR